MTTWKRRAWLAAAIAAVTATAISSVALAGAHQSAAYSYSVASRPNAIPASPPTWGTFARPSFGTLAFSPDGKMYVSDCGNARIYRVTASGRTSVFAGSGPGGYQRFDKVPHLGWVTVASYGGDGRPPTDAQFNCPIGLAFDPGGDLLIADHGNDRIRAIGTDGFVRTLAGVGPGGPHFYGPWTWGVGNRAGDGGPAIHGILESPVGIALDGAGDLFIADRDHDAVREVGTDGTLTTVAGTGFRGYNGDGMPATDAQLNRPIFVAIDAADRLYISDENNYRIRRVNKVGTITTVAGTGRYGCGGDGGLAVDASLKNPGAIAIAPDGSLLISDGECFRIRRVAPDGTISTLAGNGRHGCAGVGHDVSRLRIGGDVGLTYGPDGDLYIVDCNRIIQVDGNGITHLVATAPDR
jgi:hypothetical protein